LPQVTAVAVFLCKTVGVVLRWFESITRHHSKTAPDQAIYRSGAVVAGAEYTTVRETVGVVRLGSVFFV
jgi:hypothetical protein